jgi:hypothetical protein
MENIEKINNIIIAIIVGKINNCLSIGKIIVDIFSTTTTRFNFMLTIHE